MTKRLIRDVYEGRIKANVCADVSMEQYNRGFEVYQTGGSVSDILAATGMSRKQLFYLLSNPLPSHASKCPSYTYRLVEVQTAMRGNMVEAASIASRGGVRHVQSMDKVAAMAEKLLLMLVSGKCDDAANDDKPLFTPGENATIRTLLSLTDYKRLAETFTAVFRPPRDMEGGKNKVDLEFDTDAAIPATVATKALVSTAQSQDQDDFHQQLFRDWDSLSDGQLEEFLRDGVMPKAEKFDPEDSQKTTN